ncbi:MAG TPA: hypothetical protein VGM77_08150 [Gemmatimonadales bacterium]
MMTRRLLLLDLDPSAAPLRPRAAPWLVLPLPDHRAAVALADETAEEVLAALLADGLAIRASRVVESPRG